MLNRNPLTQFLSAWTDKETEQARFAFGANVFNGEFGNSRDASLHADGAKSRFPKRVARALRRSNSLGMASQIFAEARHSYNCGPNSPQTEQSGEAALLISLSQLPV
jgi:hypothetical protein